MAKNSNKTKATSQSVEEFLVGVEPKRQADCRELVEIMSKITGADPVMWGPMIVGFGNGA